MIICEICKKPFKAIINTHLFNHGFSIFEYKQKFGNKIVSVETSNKLKTNLGKTFTLEHRRKISEREKGKFVSEETRKKISEAKKGKISYIPSLETRQKISNALKGIKRSLEHRLKLSLANKGKKKIFSEAHKKNIQKAQQLLVLLGKKKMSDEQKQNLRNKNLGKKHSNEARLKMRLVAIKRIEKNYGIVCPSYNKQACEFFKNFDLEFNTKGRYAVYGDGEYCIRELGYFLDYINFDLKIIIEWDEKSYHYINGELCDKDKQRQKEIQQFLSDFRFFRILEDNVKIFEFKNDVKIEHKEFKQALN